MRVVVLGAGAVGATIGGRLHEAGHETVLLARGRHAEVLASNGLRLALPHRVLQLEVPVATLETLSLRPDDVLLISTKLQDADDLLRRVAALPVGTATAGDALPVVCAQNGLAGERMALRRFACVHGICVMLPATHLEPGMVAAQGSPRSGSLDIGRYPGGTDEVDEALAEVLTGSGFRSTPREDVMAWKRAKLLRNVANALTVLGGAGLEDDDAQGKSAQVDAAQGEHAQGDAARGEDAQGDAAQGHGAPGDDAQGDDAQDDDAARDARQGAAAGELRRRARAEAEAVFAAADLTVVDDEQWSSYRGNQVEIVQVEDEQRGGGSSWQSVQRGTGTVESDYLNGEIVLLGRLHGVPTPVNAALQREANAVVLRGDGPGGVDLPQLLASLP